jgi:hypothetical protein
VVRARAINDVVIDGMHGMGDNVHQRAVVRLLLRTNPATTYWLKTPWPCLYHDLICDRLRLIDPATSLRTQKKNSVREAAHYGPSPPHAYRRLRVSYNPSWVRRCGSVLGGMIRTTLGYTRDDADFRLPVPAAWLAKADALIGRQDKPVMILRPLVERTEWRGCSIRNPDAAAYTALYQAIRDRFFVVSLADLVPGVEERVTDLEADLYLHNGEADTEAIAGLMTRAALTFASPGFAVPLSQAVATPVIVVFGGFENSASFSYGARFTPTLGIDPINPCQCFSHSHACDKRIDLDAAHADIGEFIAHACLAEAERRRIADCPTSTARRQADQLERFAAPLHELGRVGSIDSADA